MRWKVVVTETARKQIRRLPQKDADRIEAVIDAMVENPFRGDIAQLAGEDTWRRRVGSYRILYHIATRERVIVIRDVVRRTSHTY